MVFGWLLAGLGGLPAAPVKMIFDTDMGGDCDDVGALFVLHGALERGEVELLATMGCVSSPDIAPAIDGINAWFGRPGIPVGVLKDPGLLEGPHFTAELARRHPGRFSLSKDYPDAVKLYRELLAKQPDRSVVVVAVGPLRNLANLLESGADAASGLDGRGLVERKVKRLEVMGGKYPPHPSKGPGDAEWNFAQCPRSAALVCERWPTPVLFNGEGGNTLSGRRVTFEMPEHNPLTLAYTLYPGTGYGGDRMSWDPISCLVAVRGAEPWYEVVGGGRNVVDPKSGSNRWEDVAGGRHSYLVLKAGKREVEDALEDLMTAGKGRPADLKFEITRYGIKGGTCQFAGSGGDKPAAAFDGDGRTAWQHEQGTSWLECRFGEDKRHRVVSYAVTAAGAERLPGAWTLSGSNDDGKRWTVLDRRDGPGFAADELRREFTLAEASVWNRYRLEFTAANPAEGVRIAEVELFDRIHCQPGKEVTGIRLDHERLSLGTLQRATLNATVAPHDRWEREIEWTSSDPAIAGVRRIGEHAAVVSARAPGVAIVTARAGGRRAEVRVEVTPSPLPAGWDHDELASPAMPGAVVVKGGDHSLTASGHAMTAFWERVRDQGGYLHRAAGGDFVLAARLHALGPDAGGPAYPWDSRPATAAGLMVRESLAEPLSRFLLIQVEASGKLVARWRDTVSQDDNQVRELGEVALPVHLKLVRKGGVVQAYTSADGKAWGEAKFSREMPFAAGARVGMFVCSGNSFVTSTARFDQVVTGE